MFNFVGDPLLCFITGFVGLIAGYFFIEVFIKPCVNHFKFNFKKSKKSEIPELSIDDVQKMLEDQEFIQMIADCLDGKSKAEPLSESTKFMVLKPCEAHNCPLHVTREDACQSSWEEGGQLYCKRIYDFNTMEEVGIDRSGNVVKLTEEECKQFASYYLNFLNKLNQREETNERN